MTLAFNNRQLLLPIALLSICFVPTIAHAEGFVSLVGLPGLEEAVAGSPENLINSFYRIAIIAAALIAVIKLIYAGAQYVMSGIVTDKENAKKDIRAALIGLLIILAAVTILRTINPGIANLPALESITVPKLTPLDSDAPYEVKRGERIRSCQGKNATDCKTDVCNPVGGSVQTKGIRDEAGNTSRVETPVCVVPATASTPTTSSSDVTIAEGLIYNTEIVYDPTRINEFIRKANELDVYIDHTKVTKNPDGRNRAINTCEVAQNGKAHIIKGEGLSGDTLLCVKK